MAALGSERLLPSDREAYPIGLRGGVRQPQEGASWKKRRRRFIAPFRMERREVRAGDRASRLVCRETTAPDCSSAMAERGGPFWPAMTPWGLRNAASDAVETRMGCGRRGQLATAMFDMENHLDIGRMGRHLNEISECLAMRSGAMV